MEPVALQKEVRVVVDEPAPYAEELVESLASGAVVWMSPQVPLAEECGAVTARLHGLGQGDFRESHVDSLLGGPPIALHPFIHSAALGVSAGQQGGSGRAAEGVGVSLGESCAGGGQLVEVGGDQVLGTVASGVERALVIGVENHNLGLVLGEDQRRQRPQRQGNESVHLFSKHIVTACACWSLPL